MKTHDTLSKTNRTVEYNREARNAGRQETRHHTYRRGVQVSHYVCKVPGRSNNAVAALQILIACFCTHVIDLHKHLQHICGWHHIWANVWP